MNFLSTGNVFTEIDFTKNKSTLIIGENGAGKSTLIDALMFALYGRAFRKINKPQLVNSITNKNALVELEFSSGKKKFLIRRGINPNIFEIYQNDVLVDQNAGSKDYQEFLEKNILKMNHKAFSQTVVLGSANYTPFMKLPLGDRRNIIEDFLDIGIFSIMNSILKEKYNDNKFKLNDNDHKIALANQAIKMAEKHLKSLNSSNKSMINTKKDLINSLNLQINQTQETIDKLSNEVDSLLKSVSDQNKLIDTRKEIINLENKLANRKKSINKEIEFFSEHDNCPTCKRDIEESWKIETIEKRKNKQSEVDKALSQIEVRISKIDSRLEAIESVNGKISQLNREIASNNADIRSWNSSISTLNEEIKKIENNTDQINESKEEVKKHEEKKKVLKDERKELIEEKEILEISASLLKDTGIKTKIIRQYIPVINKLVNKYLASLDFFVNFELDEQFNETIKSRFRDEFTYSSFSEGEKAKLDLALMFSWRALSRLRNSTSTNLLILDEVFDGSADSTSKDNLVKILETLEDTNIFIISHSEAMIDKIENTIKFEKNSNFSRIVE